MQMPIIFLYLHLRDIFLVHSKAHREPELTLALSFAVLIPVYSVSYL